MIPASARKIYDLKTAELTVMELSERRIIHKNMLFYRWEMEERHGTCTEIGIGFSTDLVKTLASTFMLRHEPKQPDNQRSAFTELHLPSYIVISPTKWPAFVGSN